jgi:hypothetical protein
MFAGPYDSNGHVPDYAFSRTALSSVAQLKKLSPELVLLPWLGGVVNRTVFLGNPEWVTNAVADAARLIQVLEVPGVHINFEFFTYAIPGEAYPGLAGIDQYADDERAFFERLRAALPQAFISTVVESTAPSTKHWKRKKTFEEIAQLSLLVDQIAILFFDTSIKDKKQFGEAMHDQLEDIRRWKTMAPNKRIQFLLGIGTFVNKPELHPFRDLGVESIPNTLTTLQKLLKTQPDLIDTVDGLAIFAEWTTTAREWCQIRRSAE